MNPTLTPSLLSNMRQEQEMQEESNNFYILKELEFFLDKFKFYSFTSQGISSSRLDELFKQIDRQEERFIKDEQIKDLQEEMREIKAQLLEVRVQQLEKKNGIK